MKWLTVEIEGKRVKVAYEKVKGQLWAHFNGKTYVENLIVKNKRQQGHGMEEGEIKAPMPGKIIKVFQQKGSSVAQNNPVFVMEAMKMEYTLKSNKTGILKNIHCQVGQQVTLGQVLAEIE